MGKELVLSKGQKLMIEGRSYRVTGGMEFHNRSDGSRWTEYQLKDMENGCIRWLSADNMYEEYAIYTQCAYSSEFDEMELFRNGYRQADKGRASVISAFGDVDTDPEEGVSYTEYEDGSGERILAVEQWEDETEYSRGYYLDLEDISLLERDNPAYGQREGTSAAASGFGGKAGGIQGKTLAVAAVLLIAAAALVMNVLASNKKTISRFLKEDTRFVYETSITCELKPKEKADVYKTDLSVDGAARAVIEGVEGNTEEVQQNEEDGSVAVLTKDEYCLIYTDMEQETLVQVSSRSYAYHTTAAPYRSTPGTHSYYRSFYYSVGLGRDRRRFKRAVSGYEDYTDGTLSADPSDPYRNYSDSVRQSSVRTRRSSGGGISSGK